MTAFNSTLLSLPGEDTNVNIESINSLAKLFATEDLSVIHSSSATTAAFNTHSRTLILPAWKGIPKVIYLLFTGHEIGHALWTPVEGFNHPLIPAKMNTSGFRSILNVTEDARIEKKAKRKYPGLRKDFIEGYRRLMSAGFFGSSVSEIAANGNVVDKLNVRFKIGSNAASKISFDNAEEIDFLERGYGLETFEDSVLLAIDIYDYLVDENDQSDDGDGDRGDERGESDDDDSDSDGSSDDSDDDDSDDDDFDSDGSEGGSDDDDDSDDSDSDDSDSDDSDSDDSDSDDSDDADDADDSDGSSDDSDDDDSDDDESDGSSDSDGADGDSNEDDFDPRSETDDAVNKNSEGLVDSEYAEPKRLTIPFDRIDPNHYIHDTKRIVEEFDTVARQTMRSKDIDNFFSDLRTACNEYVKSCNPVVGYLAKEFEMKKAADQHRRSSISRTGVIDIGKLHSYKYNEDVFLRKTMMPDAKNHGLVMFIDLSGSMQSNMAGTVEQLINLVLFCKKVSIPFEVYGFGDCSSSRPDESSNFINGDIVLDGEFYLRKYISSDLKTSMFKKALDYLFFMKEHFQNQYGRTNSNSILKKYWMRILREDSLGSTPLNDAIIAAGSVVKNFREKSGVQICNVVFLTDGESNSLQSCCEIDETGGKNLSGDLSGRNYRDTIIYDEKSRKSHVMGDTWEATKETTVFLLRSLANYCGVKLAGFFVVSGSAQSQRRDLSKFVDRRDNLSYAHSDDVEAAYAAMKKNGVHVSNGRSGYDAHFVIRGGKNLQTDEESVLDGVADNSKVSTIRSAFKKGSKKKIQSRILLTKFIDLIA